jgi:Xaa-Pro aminopeptidase
MEPPVFAERLTRLRQRLSEMAPDTAWIIQPENRRYLSGFRAEDTQFTESSGSLFITATLSFLTTDSRYTLEAEAETAGFEVVTLKKGLIEGMPSVMDRTMTRNLGFEKDYVTWGLHQDIAEKLQGRTPPVELSPLDGLVVKMREVKDEAEIRAIEASADFISRILDDVASDLEPGLTEREVAWRIEGLAREYGADRLAFPSIVGSGPNGALPHAVPTDRRLRAGEPIVFDMGVRLDGYCSDMTRTLFLGDPDPEFRNIYHIVRQAQLAALAEIRPGVQSDHPDAVARGVIRDAGFGDYFGHALGHGVGLATHEGPRLSPLKPVTLKKGMVVTVEPGIYIPDKGGVRLEEMVLIEEKGVRILTRNRRIYDFS